HLEILFASLVHDGRFPEARAIKREMEQAGFKPWLAWSKLHLAERSWSELLRVADLSRRTEKTTAAYLAALAYLHQGDAARALPEIQVLQEAFHCRGADVDRRLEPRLLEAQGLYLCQTGHEGEGLKLLQRAAEKTKHDYAHHAWGNGAYYMEAWGLAALRARQETMAEEAFLEALAHDPGSVRAALGLQVLCERQ